MYDFEFVAMIIGVMTMVLMCLGLLNVIFNMMFSKEKTVQYYVDKVKGVMSKIDDNERFKEKYYES